MEYIKILKTLKEHGNCYLANHPSKETLRKLKVMLDTNIIVKNAVSVDGYVLEVVK